MASKSDTSSLALQRFRSRCTHAFLQVKLIQISYRTLRKVALALLAVVFLVVVTVISIKDITRRRREALEGDFPDFSKENSGSFSRKNLASKADFPFEVGCRVPDTDAPRANAAFVMLARNSEIDNVVKSMKSMERHFNQWFNYPWVFLNDVEFDDNFQSTVKEYTNSEVEFGVVPKEQWEFPDTIDEDLFNESIESQGDREIMYGNMPSYHKMCRFYSGRFFDHPLVAKREWYWRVEPDVQFFCDLTYDPFIEMAKNNKKYGFTVTIQELYYTVPSLFKETKSFIKESGINVGSAWDIIATKFFSKKGKNAHEYVHVQEKDNLRKEIEKNLNLKKILAIKKKSNRHLEKIQEFKFVRNIFEQAYEKPPLFEDKFEDEEYNLCHFWTNFEIARVDLFKSETYQSYFNYLENSGGFYRERWGDAPVHSLAVAMMLQKEEIHYFRDIGYKHTTLGHCPSNAPGKQLPYEPSADFNDKVEKTWYDIFRSDEPDKPAKNGVGCRCQCPPMHKELEDRNADCIKHYVKVMSDDYKPETPADIDIMERTVQRSINRYLRKGGEVGLHGAI